MNVMATLKAEHDRYIDENKFMPTLFVLSEEKGFELLGELFNAVSPEERTKVHEQWEEIMLSQDAEAMITMLNTTEIFGVRVLILEDYILIGSPK